MTIASYPMLLPVIFSDVDNGTTLQSGTIAVFPFQGFSDLVRALSHMAGTSEDEITIFVERSTKERVRMVAHTDLIRQRVVCLHVIVGLPRGACKMCEKALNYSLLSEFHLCIEDKTVTGEYFRSTAFCC
jgi:hypothetical protein